MALLETDNCWPGNGWENGGTESPAGWRYFAGDGNGNLGPRRPMPEGTVYAEWDLYWDSLDSDRFVRVGLSCTNGGREWDPNGYSVLISSVEGMVDVPPNWNNGTYVVGSPRSVFVGGHNSPETALTIGVGVVDGDLLVYVAGRLVYRITGGTGFPTGPYAIASAYNWAGAHYNEVRFYDAVPADAPPPVGPLLETDNCWPGSGWFGGGAEGPTGWRYYSGVGNGELGPQRPMPEGAIYAEFDFYWEGTGYDSWVRMGVGCPSSFVAWGAGGYCVAIRPDGTIGTNGWYNGTFVLGSEGSASLGLHTTPGNAATIGVGTVNGDLLVYIDRELVYHLTGGSPPTGAFAVATAYNYAYGHYNEVRFYNTLPGAAEEFTANDAAQINADLNVGIGSPNPSAYVQADLHLGVGTGSQLAGIHADVNADRLIGPEPAGFIQADLNVTATLLSTSEAALQADVNIVGTLIVTRPNNLAPVGVGRVPVGAIHELPLGIIDEEGNQLVDENGDTLIWS